MYVYLSISQLLIYSPKTAVYLMNKMIASQRTYCWLVGTVGEGMSQNHCPHQKRNYSAIIFKKISETKMLNKAFLFKIGTKWNNNLINMTTVLYMYSSFTWAVHNTSMHSDHFNQSVFIHVPSF